MISPKTDPAVSCWIMWQTSGIIGQAAGFVRGSRFRPPCTLRQIAEPDSCFWKRRSRGRRDERISFSLLNNQATFFYSHPWICYLVVQPFDRPQDSPTLLVGQLIEFWPKLSHELPSTSAAYTRAGLAVTLSKKVSTLLSSLTWSIRDIWTSSLFSSPPHLA